MTRRSPVLACLLAVSTMLGCRETRQPLAYLGDEPLRYYQEAATRITPPPEPCQPTPPSTGFVPPRRLGDPRKDDVWELPLAEAIRIALANAAIVRSDEQFLARGSVLTGNALAAPSIFDPALRQSGFSFGQRGVEAALSDFDTRFTTQMLWGRSENVQNSLVLSGGLPPGSTLTDETGDFNSRLEKRLGNGGTVGVQHDWDYSLNNRPGQLFGSAYTGLLRADYRQPLWAGSGVEFTRIAGPTAGDVQTVVDQGVVIARINEDVSLTDFEEDVRNLLRDVEQVYWDLVLAYHVYHVEVDARDKTLELWRDIKANVDVAKTINERTGKPHLTRLGTADESQSRDQYFEFRARSESALADVYETETRLRRLLGLPINEGRVIRPSDAPMTAEIDADWEASLVTALTRRVELRRQKWRVKSLELQLRAAENLVHPRLDFVSSYQRNGFGDRLFAGSDDDGITTQGFRNAYETLSQGGHDSWTLGFEFSVPLGQRLAHSRTRNIELQLAKARAGLAALELEIGHELSIAFQRLDRSYFTARSNHARARAAFERADTFRVRYKNGTDRLADFYLRSLSSVAAAKTAYYQSLVQYNQSIAELHFRSGTLLDQDRVHLGEGPWEPAAYDLALRRAVARSHGINASAVLDAEPPPFAAPGAILPIGWEVEEPLEELPAELPPPDDDAIEPLPELDEFQDEAAIWESESTDIRPVEVEGEATDFGEERPIGLLEWLNAAEPLESE